LIPASYACIAPANCRVRARLGALERAAEGGAGATEVRLDATAANFAGPRSDPLGRALAALPEPFEDAALEGFAFRRTDLAAADARAAGFFVGFDFGFAFIAIVPQLIRLMPR
jgi:hypothetical protein